jgi:hypothetical protein
MNTPFGIRKGRFAFKVLARLVPVSLVPPQLSERLYSKTLGLDPSNKWVSDRYAQFLKARIPPSYLAYPN